MRAQFKTPLGRQVYTAVFQPQRRSVAEKFQPRRTAFVYELDDDEDGLDIPTTLYRSKADCPKACLSSKQAVNLMALPLCITNGSVTFCFQQFIVALAGKHKHIDGICCRGADDGVFHISLRTHVSCGRVHGAVARCFRIDVSERREKLLGHFVKWGCFDHTYTLYTPMTARPHCSQSKPHCSQSKPPLQ